MIPFESPADKIPVKQSLRTEQRFLTRYDQD